MKEAKDRIAVLDYLLDTGGKGEELVKPPKGMSKKLIAQIQDEVLGAPSLKSGEVLGSPEPSPTSLESPPGSANLSTKLSDNSFQEPSARSLKSSTTPLPSSKTARYVSPIDSYSRKDISDNDYITETLRISKKNFPFFKEDIETATGLKFIPTSGVKPEISLRDKLANERREGRDPRKRIGDVVRATVLADTPESAAEIFRSLPEKLRESGLKIAEENGKLLSDNYFEKPVNGYRGINIKVELPNGQKAELQIHTDLSYRIKEWGHVTRYKSEARKKMSPAEKEIFDAESTRLYDEKWNNGGEGLPPKEFFYEQHRKKFAESGGEISSETEITAQRTKPRSDVPQTFRTDKLNLSESDTMKVKATFEALGLDTRNVQTFDEVKEIADELGKDPLKLIRDIQSNDISAQEVLALRDTINASARYLGTIHDLLAKTDIPLEKTKILERAAQHEEVLEKAVSKLVKGGTRSGRAVSAFRLIARDQLDPAYWLKEAQRSLDKNPTPKRRQLTGEMVTAVNDLIRRKDRLGLAHFVNGLQESSNPEKLITLWKAGLLTSPTTHLANLGGNTTMQILETVKDVPATVIDWGVFQVTGKRTKAFTLQNFVRQGRGFEEGFQRAKDYLKTGIDSERTLLKYDIPKQVNFNNAFLQVYTETIFRSLGAGDKLFRYGSLRKSIYEQAVVMVKNMDDKQVKNFLADLGDQYGEKATRKDLVEYLFKNPTDEMSRIAINDAEYATFLRENSLASGIASFKRKQGDVGRAAVEVIAPFTRTPTNLAATIVDYSPAGFLTTLAKGLKDSGQKEIVEGLGRAITGTAVISLGAALARDGLMTGTRPRTKKERELWAANGIQNQSLFYKGEWRRLDRVSPLGNLLAIGAEFNKFGEDRTTMDRFKQTAFAGLKGITEQSFLLGVSRGLNVITEPERYASSFIENTIGSVIPSILGRIAQGLDTKRRDPETLAQVLMARIPILSERVPARVDPFGREVTSRDGVIRRTLDPFSSSAPTGDPVAWELLQLNHPLSIPSKGLFSQQEQSERLRLRGTVLVPLLTSLMSNPQYQTMNDDQRKYAIDAIERESTKFVNDMMKPVLAKRLSLELKEMTEEDRNIRFKQIQKKDQTTSLLIEQIFSQMQ